MRFTNRGESWMRKLVSSSSERVVISVDNTTVLQGNEGRPAVRIESKKSSLALKEPPNHKPTTWLVEDVCTQTGAWLCLNFQKVQRPRLQWWTFRTEARPCSNCLRGMASLLDVWGWCSTFVATMGRIRHFGTSDRIFRVNMGQL